MAHFDWLLGLSLLSLLNCSQPQELKELRVEPVMDAGPVKRNPLPRIAEPTGEPSVERDPPLEMDTP
jgi:hypothetical protein